MPWKTCMWRGKAQVETAAVSAVVLANVLASGEILQGGLAVFVVSLLPSPFVLPLPASPSSPPNTKGLQGHCLGWRLCEWVTGHTGLVIHLYDFA